MQRWLSRAWLIAGAFGGEAILLLSLPTTGRLFGHAEVAILGIAIVAANAGKLLGCLKLDAAITNASDTEVVATHALAATMAVLTGLLVTMLAAVVVRIGWWTPEVALHAFCVAFVGGAIQQATTMRLLRDERLAVFALVKAMPSLSLVVLVFGWRPDGLLQAYEVAWGLTASLAIALHLRPGPGGLRLRHHLALLRRLRPYMAKGVPASAMDAANLFSLSLLTVVLAGAEVAGVATQIQRIALAPSLAASLLISQHVWRQPVGRSHLPQVYRHSLWLTHLIGLVSLGLSVALAAGAVRVLAIDVPPDTSVGIICCLAPLLSQYIASPLTVFFFKSERIGLYGLLQILLLALLGLTAGVGLALQDTKYAGSWVLPALSLVSLPLTVVLSRRAVIHP